MKCFQLTVLSVFGKTISWNVAFNVLLSSLDRIIVIFIEYRKKDFRRGNDALLTYSNKEVLFNE